MGHGYQVATFVASSSKPLLLYYMKPRSGLKLQLGTESPSSRLMSKKGHNNFILTLPKKLWNGFFKHVDSWNPPFFHVLWTWFWGENLYSCCCCCCCFSPSFNLLPGTWGLKGFPALWLNNILRRLFKVSKLGGNDVCIYKAWARLMGPFFLL